MKTKRTRLAPIAVASLLAGVRQARYNVKRDDSCGAQRSGASRKKIIIGANALSILKVLYYFYFLFVYSLRVPTQKN